MSDATWRKIVVVLIIGYHAFTRGFAYIGLPAADIYVGEIVFATALLTKPELIFKHWLDGLNRPSQLSAVSFFILASLGYGGWQTVRGVLLGYPTLATLRDFVFDYYPLFFFMGVWASAKDAPLLPRALKMLGWVGGSYGVIFVIFLQASANEYMDPTEASNAFRLTEPGSTAFSLLAMLCFEQTRWRDWPIFVLNGLSLLALQIRAEWLALITAGGLWAVLKGRVGRAVALVLALILLLATIDLVGIKLQGRTGDVSFTETAARIVAPFSPDLAIRLSPEHSDSHIGTMQFRSEWWALIWANVNADPTRFMFGYGFGFPLRTLVLDAGASQMAVRTPHNVFFFSLGYTGWIGVLLFFGMQASIAVLAWRTFRATRQPFAIIYWVASLVVSFLSPLFETPFGAIPFYLVMGMAVAPVVARQHVAAAVRTSPRPTGQRRGEAVPARVD